MNIVPQITLWITTLNHELFFANIYPTIKNFTWPVIIHNDNENIPLALQEDYKIINTDKNKWCLMSRYTIMKEAKTKYVLFIDDDDLVHENIIDNLSLKENIEIYENENQLPSLCVMTWVAIDRKLYLSAINLDIIQESFWTLNINFFEPLIQMKQLIMYNKKYTFIKLPLYIRNTSHSTISKSDLSIWFKQWEIMIEKYQQRLDSR